MRGRIGIAGIGIAAALLAAVSAGSGAKETKSPKPTVVEGTLIDTKCFSQDAANDGNDHGVGTEKIEGCAEACAKLGIPVGLLTSKREVFILIAPAEAFEEHMGKAARVTGPKVYRGSAIRPDSVHVQGADGAWVPVEFHSMM